MDILKKQIQSSGRDGLSQIKTLSENFEKKIYESATDENDYLKKISLKLLTVEEKLSQSNSLLSKSYSGETQHHAVFSPKWISIGNRFLFILISPNINYHRTLRTTLHLADFFQLTIFRTSSQ
ncbi:hypothetical protein I3842_13G017100 [Carya illinoinensis]|uniref:Mediator complex subunit 15 KIX domain-containing protein n=1 Tax=Carya illinoinensis TaxID=32201 RepID=A0A922DAY3_CARIL|nr:hypothetical protein I3842_13G017100 [Carya illinoinensis]